MAEHTIKAFDEEMDKLRGLIAEMGGRAESALENAPMANDLRDVIAALKIVGVVERIGDYAKNIAKRVPLINANQRTQEPIALLPSMGQVAGEMVQDALNAFAARDADLALAVIERDTVVDDFYNSVFRTLVTFMVENPKTISECAHLLFVAKNIERIGDHATNVAEMVYYAATGQTLPERERGGTQPLED